MHTEQQRIDMVKAAKASGNILQYEKDNKLKKSTISNWNRQFDVYETRKKFRKPNILAEKPIHELKDIIFKQEIQIRKQLLKTIRKNKEILDAFPSN